MSIHMLRSRYWPPLMVLLAATLLVAPVALPQAAEAAVPGGVYVWPLPVGADQVRFADKPVLVFQQHAMVGVPITQPVGVGEISYRQSGQQRRQTFNIIAKTYSEQHITLENQEMVTPSAETLARIREESRRQQKLYATHTPLANLSGGFIKPLEGITTSLFGHRRFFNNQPRNPHSGLDIAADTGTPIKAAGAARVTLADNLYFNGNTLFLDHGQGLVTMYCHMSKLLVAAGDVVDQGQAIGLVGATGRATGPHLHWSVSLNGSRVDPLDFVQQFNNLLSTQVSSGG